MNENASDRFDVAAIKRSHPLSEVVAASGVALRPVGRDRFRGRGPFHADRGPNLLVDERDGHVHYYCFGWQAHGDVIDFVMHREGVTFSEAYRRLSERPSQPKPARSAVQHGAAERRWDRLTLEQQVVMNTAGAIYQHCLWRDARALAYARGRGLPDWVIRRCALGYADGHTLEGYLRRRSGLRVAQDLGLLRRDPKRPRREFLAGRLVVPELRAGQFVWFIGRRLDDDGPGPKYLALSGERPVLGFERAAGRRDVFLCEGVADYLTAVAWRLPAFSPCGMSLPAERLGFLAPARVVYGVLDGDNAGRAAAESFGAFLDFIGRHPFLSVAQLSVALGREVRALEESISRQLATGLLHALGPEETGSGADRVRVFELTRRGLDLVAEQQGLSLARAIQLNGLSGGGPTQPIGSRRILATQLAHTWGVVTVHGAASCPIAPATRAENHEWRAIAPG